MYKQANWETRTVPWEQGNRQVWDGFEVAAGSYHVIKPLNRIYKEEKNKHHHQCAREETCCGCPACGQQLEQLQPLIQQEISVIRKKVRVHTPLKIVK